jgi:two-component system, OmpR family, sensor histidine kinase VicK
LLYEPHNQLLVEAYKGRITQVISNLLSNAINFTNEGSKTIFIDVSTKQQIHNNSIDKKVILSINDNGAGIDREILPRLFTKFASKSETGGTGLGLFISKSIVEAHGGEIWAENNVDGKGATFHFSIPVSSR